MSNWSSFKTVLTCYRRRVFSDKKLILKMCFSFLSVERISGRSSCYFFFRSNKKVRVIVHFFCHIRYVLYNWFDVLWTNSINADFISGTFSISRVPDWMINMDTETWHWSQYHHYKLSIMFWASSVWSITSVTILIARLMSH